MSKRKKMYWVFDFVILLEQAGKSVILTDDFALNFFYF